MLIQQIACTTQFDETNLKHLAASANRRYKVYEIPKRDGGKRLIEHPSRELKALQRWINKVVIDRFPVHYSATAYRKGSGIKDNAERHRRTNFTNRYDFTNFFPSFKQTQVEIFVKTQALKLGMQLNDEDLSFLGNVVCRYGHLTIGAPSSPAITNAMMFDFDDKLFKYCQTLSLVYTRYADDLFISSFEPGKLKNLEPKIAFAKRNIPHLSLRLNRKKTAYLSKKYIRRVAGVIITPDHKLSIGRDRKREIKSLIHHWVTGRLDLMGVQRLRGLVAFARDIEPAFEQSVRTKYGTNIITEILRHPNLQSTPDPEYNNWDI